MIAEIGGATSRFARRFIPDPFPFALALTAVVLVGGCFSLGGPLDARAIDLLRSWYGGLWDPGGLRFALQMCLILVTGHALATSPGARRLLRAVAGRFRTGTEAACLTAAVSISLAYLHWGLGLVGGGLLAREVKASAARRRVAIDYPLVVSCAYLSLLVWHGGLSGSAPLSVASPGHPLEAEAGVIPLRETIFSRGNLALALALLVALPFLASRLARSPRAEVPPPEEEAPRPRESVAPGPASRIEGSRALALLFFALGVATLACLPADRRTLDFDSLNFALLLLGLALHGGPRAYAEAVSEGARSVGGILLQFPFYFGILGVMRGSGLLLHLSRWTVDASRALASVGLPARAGFPLLVWLGAAVVNLFIPSGGGQWAVQGPIVVEAAKALGVSVPRTVLALAYGDEWTNMVQPFWAVPLVGLTGVGASRILGASVALMLLVGPLFVVALLL